MRNPSYHRFTTSRGTVRHLAARTHYYYRVSALRYGRQISPFSVRGRGTSTLQLAGPAHLSITSTSSTTVNLAWDALAGVGGYRVVASKTPDYTAPIQLRTLAPSASMIGLASATTYYFRVVATSTAGASLTRYSGTVQTTTAPTPPLNLPIPVIDGPADVRVGSYNVQSVSLDVKSGEQHPWRERRAGVLANILGEKLDVIGLQEANPSTIFQNRLVTGNTQFGDILNGLRSGGQNFALTNEYMANCVNATTSFQCKYQNRGVAGSERIMYNADRIVLVSQGGYTYPTQDPDGTTRNLAYAVLQVARTGDRFLFVSTHLESRTGTIRYKQWGEMIAKVAQLKGSLPVVAVGDYNMQKFAKEAAIWLPAMKKAGMGDVLNQEYAVNPGQNVRAQRRINGWLNTANHLNRDVTTFGYADRRDKTGNNIDYVFATNSLVVKEWKVVLNFDPVTLKVRGIIPSDHNMVRATITLP